MARVTATVPANGNSRRGPTQAVQHAGPSGVVGRRGFDPDFLRAGIIEPLGIGPEDVFRQSDLQVAATGWLAQHRLFMFASDLFHFTARGGRGNEGTIQIDGMNVGRSMSPSNAQLGRPGCPTQTWWCSLQPGHQNT